VTAVVVLTTVAADFDAAPLARALVEAKLAACVSILPPMTSFFWWEGKIEEDPEHLLLIKTTDDRVNGLREELLARHPYAVPEFIVLRSDSVSEAYAAWIESSTR
jgi:periplasmic divalent cation tolerance protein